MTALGTAVRRPDLASRFGQRLRQSRESADISQSRLAEIFDLHPSYISRLETGERLPSVELLIALAHHFQWSLDDVMGVIP